MKKAVILLSGGLDSTTCLAIAKAEGFACYALSFDYHQRHIYELNAAKEIARAIGVIDHRTVNINIAQFGGSSLTDTTINVPESGSSSDTIPNTYVPARNIIFLSIATAFAETIGAYDIFIGVNAIDYSNYPDCRPAFIEAFQTMANCATKAGIEGNTLRIHAPLLHLSKADIIRKGVALGVDYGQTVSCYQLNRLRQACGRCDSCRLRQQGFDDANMNDPTIYI